MNTMTRMLLRWPTTARTRWIICTVLLGIEISTLAVASNVSSGPVDAQSLRLRADALIAQMTPEEKAGQLTQLFRFGESGEVGEALAASLRQGKVGSLLFVTDPNLINLIQKEAVDGSRLKIPVLFGFDVIHGFRTIFPAPIGMAATWDPALVQQCQEVAAAEARAVGIHWTFAPMVDIARDPRWGRIFESAGEDPYLGSAMAVAQIRGFQGEYIGSPERIIAGPKHFAGYGAAPGGRDNEEVNLSDSEFWNVYLPPFRAAIQAGAGNIMTAYMPVNGVPATGNRWLLTEVLRGNLGFEGFVVSDANAVKDLAVHHFAEDRADAAVLALNAGVDMEMAVGKVAFSHLPEALAAGRIDVTTLDDAVRRVLMMKFRMGLFDSPFVDTARAEKVLSNPAHREKARIAAERASVLLRNEGAFLPLSRHALKRVAVIGPLADAPRQTLGPWVFAQDVNESVSILAGIRAKLGPDVRVDFAWGPEMEKRVYASPFDGLTGKAEAPAEKLDAAGAIERAVDMARNADVAVVVLGETQDMIGESASRASMALPVPQESLLNAVVATGKPVVLILMTARPLDLRRIVTKVPAILLMWYPGSQGGTAAANLLFGDAVPGGKLPFSWLRSIGQAPTYYGRLTSHTPWNAKKRYWDEESTPLFPFGFGLSYSSFAFDNLRLDRTQIPSGGRLTVFVDLANTGTRRADEVAQLYLHQRFGSAARPVRELKGFQRVSLDAGEKRTIAFQIGPEELKYWSSASRDWVLEAAKFDLWVGGDSDATLKAGFEMVNH